LPTQLQGFFETWPYPPAPETHLRILNRSDYVFVAVDEETGQVVGFITAISDGVLSAYIPLLEVLKPFQNQGIGTKLMLRMLDQLNGLYMIDLLCDFELEHFYQRFNMKPAFGMRIRNYENQSGKS
jgi:ribosomal protein S18 acetylase RimI-like enzyme